MTNLQAARELAALPPDARRVVLDLITVLRAPKKVSASAPKLKHRPIEKEKFIGLWRDRKDMADSTLWVKSIREREWSR